MSDQSGLLDPKNVMPSRDPREGTNQALIFDSAGTPFRKPKIVAKECMKANQGWTKDPQVAAARRESRQVESPPPPGGDPIPAQVVSPDRDVVSHQAQPTVDATKNVKSFARKRPARARPLKETTTVTSETEEPDPVVTASQ